MAELEVSPTAYREAIEAALPCGGEMTLNVVLVGGLAQVSVRCGQLRWYQSMAIAGRSPEAVAENVSNELRAWVLRTFAAVGINPKQKRAFMGFRKWLEESPERNVWLYGKEKEAA